MVLGLGSSATTIITDRLFRAGHEGGMTEVRVIGIQLETFLRSNHYRLSNIA